MSNAPTVAKLQQIVCFGIGNFSNCQISRYQLAFVLALKSALAVDRCTFHEPVLAAGEVNVLQSLDIHVYSANVEGKLRLNETDDGPTLVYLPHCPKQLTNNFLWANWTPNTLQHVSLVCNSFDELIASTPRRFLDIDAQYIVRLQRWSQEFRLANSFRFRDIFNDTSLHTFGNLPPAQDPFWTGHHDEPVYSAGATELITQIETTLSLQSIVDL